MEENLIGGLILYIVICLLIVKAFITKDKE